MANIIGKRSTCIRALKYGGIGAILVEEKSHRILGAGYVGSASGQLHCIEVGCIMENGGCTRTIHAEANAIQHAKWFGGKKILYTTVSPCESCFRLAQKDNVSTIVYRDEYRIIEPIRELAKEFNVNLVCVPPELGL